MSNSVVKGHLPAAIELLLAAALLGLALSWIAPVKHGAGASMPVTSLIRLLQDGPVLVVDARADSAYRVGRIPGAVQLSEGDWDAGLAGFLEKWTPGLPVVVYCDSAACRSSEQVAARLREELGIANVLVLEGGWEAWQQAGQPIESSQS